MLGIKNLGPEVLKPWPIIAFATVITFYCFKSRSNINVLEKVKISTLKPLPNMTFITIIYFFSKVGHRSMPFIKYMEWYFLKVFTAGFKKRKLSKMQGLLKDFSGLFFRFQGLKV